MNLFENLHIGLSSLLANQYGISITGDNIANANSPGFSRRTALFQPADSVFVGAGFLGMGVEVADIHRVTDRLLQAQVIRQQSNTGYFTSLDSSLEQLEAVLDENAGGLLDGLGAFFDSFAELANDPTNISLRESVLSAANSLAQTLNGRYSDLQRMQSDRNAEIAQTVLDINGITSEIAQLNEDIAAQEATGHDASTLRDRRDLLLEDLSGKVEVQYWEDETGRVSVAVASGGRALVTGNRSFELEAQSDPLNEGFYSVVLHQDGIDVDLTSNLDGGQLGALIEMRDEVIPEFMTQLDTFATTLANEVNAIHSAGFDLDGNPGGDFFDATGGAAGFSVLIDDPRAIAAADVFDADGDGVFDAGGNGNALALSSLRDSFVFDPFDSDGDGEPDSGQTFGDYLASMIGDVGRRAATAEQSRAAAETALVGLENQRDSVRGVSLDEEAVNLMMYQRAYEAAVRYIAVIDELTAYVISELG